MGFAERAAAKTVHTGPPCQLEHTLAGLPAKVRKDAITAIRGTVLGTSLVVIFEEDGIPISIDQVRRHRTGSCKKCREAGVFPRPAR